MDPTTKQALSRSFANTYETSSSASPWELCQQYQAFLEYTGEHPNAGRVRVANNMLDEPVPPGRVRTWLDGGRPDAMHGIQAAEERGWLDLTWDGPTLHNLAVAVAWVFAGGSITDDWVPYLTTESETGELAMDLLRALDTRPERIRSEDGSRAEEVRPTEAATTLGRLLTVLGAPQGPKHPDRELTLPAWLDSAPHQLRVAFARTYVWHRGTPRDDLPRLPIQFKEERAPAFTNSVRAFLNETAGSEVCSGESKTTRLTQEGAALFNQPPEIR